MNPSRSGPNRRERVALVGASFGWWSLGGTIGVHAVLAALILRAPKPRTLPRAQPHIEFRLQSYQPVSPLSLQRPPLPLPREPLATPRPQDRSLLPPREPLAASLPQRPPPSPPRQTPPIEGSPRVPARRSSAEVMRPSAHRAVTVPPLSADKETPPADSQEVARDLRSVDLLPTGVLRRLAESSAPIPGSAHDATGAAPDQRTAQARLAQERVQGWLDSDADRYRVASGAVDPLWRDLERTTKDLFQPPEELVRSGQTKMTVKERLLNHVTTLAKQILTSPQQVEHGTLPRGEFAERGPAGGPEDNYRLGMAAQQQYAVMEAWKKPGSWRRTEIELVMTASGEVESVQIVSSCGAKKLDRIAAEAIEKAARRRYGPYTGKRAITRWAVESAYAANPPHQIGFSFDETGNFRKNARGIHKYLGNPMYLAGGHIETRITLLSLHEPRG